MRSRRGVYPNDCGGTGAAVDSGIGAPLEMMEGVAGHDPEGDACPNGRNPIRVPRPWAPLPGAASRHQWFGAAVPTPLQHDDRHGVRMPLRDGVGANATLREEELEGPSVQEHAGDHRTGEARRDGPHRDDDPCRCPPLLRSRRLMIHTMSVPGRVGPRTHPRREVHEPGVADTNRITASSSRGSSVPMRNVVPSVVAISTASRPHTL
jgi:hypothetical protein